MGTVIVITSGKGGTGKTSLAGGVGSALALQGKRVLCIDGDVGLRNLDITLGMTDAALMDFSDVISGRCELDRAVAPHPTVSNLYLLTAPLTLPEDFPGESGFRALLEQARASYDFILIDSPAGLGPGFRMAVSGADRAIVVAVSDPSSLRDAQRVVTQLSNLPTVHLVVNRVKRRLRECFRLRMHTLKNGFYVFVARPEAADATYEQLDQAMNSLLKSQNLYRDV